MTYLILLAPSANRVYAEHAAELSAAELEIVAGSAVGAITPTEIAGIPYLQTESGPGDDDHLVDRLSRLSTAWALFRRAGDDLRPIRRVDHDRFADDLVTIPKYPGKTNEQFTRLMINIAASSAPRLTSGTGPPGTAGSGTPSLLDPICGRGTSLSLGLTLGFDVAGVDTDVKALEAYAAFLKTYLRRKRIKHTAELNPVRRDGKSLGRRFDVEVRSPIDDTGRNLTMFSGDTRDSAALFGKRRFDLVVADAPYGVVHGSRSGAASAGRGAEQDRKRDRSPATLLEQAVPVWAGQLKAGGALALSWNTYGMTREQLTAVAESSGLRPLNDGPYLRLAHRVDASIHRDLFVAVRS